jgi:hypothetical protein
MSRNWFGIGVRLIGLWQIVDGLVEFVTYGETMLGLYRPSNSTPIAYLTSAIVHLVIGVFLLFSAMSVVNAVYPPSDVISEDPPAEK